MPQHKELRVHGVSGTPPEAMLYLGAVTYDQSKEHARVFRERTPDDYDVEAYHWGSLTSGNWKTAYWVLLTPFLLANVAGWMGRNSSPWFRFAVTTRRGGPHRPLRGRDVDRCHRHPLGMGPRHRSRSRNSATPSGRSFPGLPPDHPDPLHPIAFQPSRLGGAIQADLLPNASGDAPQEVPDTERSSSRAVDRPRRVGAHRWPELGRSRFTASVTTNSSRAGDADDGDDGVGGKGADDADDGGGGRDRGDSRAPLVDQLSPRGRHAQVVHRPGPGRRSPGAGVGDAGHGLRFSPKGAPGLTSTNSTSTAPWPSGLDPP